MIKILFLLFLIDISISAPLCKKGENYCAICNPITKLCIQCENDEVFIPDGKGGCVKANKCRVGKNYCNECSEDEKLCNKCAEEYFPDENGGCSYSYNCEISFKGKCLKCKENFILNQNLNICKSILSEDFKNCEKIQNSDGKCEKCEEGYFLSSEDKRCSKIENCRQSAFGICLLCNQEFYLDKIDGKCKKQTGNLMYCKEVIDGKTCNECEHNYYFDQKGNCVSTNFCENGANGVCKKCLSGYYLSKFGNTCTNQENCYEGIKSIGICEKCISGFYIDYEDGKCKSNQEENEIKNCVKVDGECIECSLRYYLGEDRKCAKTIYCAESINGTCIACKENYYLGLDNQCSKVEHCIYTQLLECQECENNYYYDKKSKKCKLWDEIFNGCKYGHEDKGCERCKDDYYLNKTEKICYNNNLNDSFYKCATTDDNGELCASCINGYTLRNKYHRCSNIDGCILQESDNKCIECNSAKCLNVKTGLCENNNNRAEKRYYKCKRTNEDGSTCDECLEGYIIDEEGFCVTKK